MKNRLAAAACVAAVIAVLGAAESACGQPRLVKDVYGVGVAGNCCTHGEGIVGMFRARKDTRVVAAYEANPRRAKELAGAIGSPLAASYDALIADPRVDIVAVTCDPCDKATIVEKAAKAGKHVFLNKPGCDSLEAARRIARAVAERRVWLVYDIPMVRFLPVYARLLEESKTQSYGKVLGYHHLFGMNFDPAFDLAAVWPERLDPPHKSGGGEMTNMGCYAIDYAVSLLGRPRAVSAKWRKEWDVYRRADVEHFGQIVLDYGEFVALLEVGKQQLVGPSRYSNRLSIDFEHKALLIDAAAEQAAVNHVPVPWGDFTRGATAVGSIDQLLGALRRGTPPTSNVQNLVDATEVLMAAYESIVERRPVSLPLPRGDNPLTRARVEERKP